MTEAIEQYTKELSELYEASGLPRSVAQIVTYLTVCEPAKQTAADLQCTLKLSAGSVSTALNMLRTGGLVMRNKATDSRHYTYELDSDAWERSMYQRLTMLDQLVDAAEKGVRVMPHNARLSAMHDVYLYFGHEFKGLLDRYERHKKNGSEPYPS